MQRRPRDRPTEYFLMIYRWIRGYIEKHIDAFWKVSLNSQRALCMMHLQWCRYHHEHIDVCQSCYNFYNHDCEFRRCDECHERMCDHCVVKFNLPPQYTDIDDYISRCPEIVYPITWKCKKCTIKQA